jgi:hypothetical protein
MRNIVVTKRAIQEYFSPRMGQIWTKLISTASSVYLEAGFCVATGTNGITSSDSQPTSNQTRLRSFSQPTGGLIESGNRIVNGQASSGSFNPGNRIGVSGEAYLWNCEENENFFWIRYSAYPTEDDTGPPTGAEWTSTSIADAGYKTWDFSVSVTTPTTNCPYSLYGRVELGWVPSNLESNIEEAVGLEQYRFESSGFLWYHWIV